MRCCSESRASAGNSSGSTSGNRDSRISPSSDGQASARIAGLPTAPPDRGSPQDGQCVGGDPSSPTPNSAHQRRPLARPPARRWRSTPATGPALRLDERLEGIPVGRSSEHSHQPYDPSGLAIRGRQSQADPQRSRQLDNPGPGHPPAGPLRHDHRAGLAHRSARRRVDPVRLAASFPTGCPGRPVLRALADLSAAPSSPIMEAWAEREWLRCGHGRR